MGPAATEPTASLFAFALLVGDGFAERPDGRVHWLITKGKVG
jgi:hypothetical protein